MSFITSDIKVFFVVKTNQKSSEIFTVKTFNCMQGSILEYQNEDFSDVWSDCYGLKSGLKFLLFSLS